MTFTSLDAAFRAQRDRVPQAPAVSCGAVRLTYAELDRRADRLARRIEAAGGGPGRPVALLLDRSADVPVALLAAVRTGGWYVPLHESWPPDRNAAILTDTAVPVLVTDATMRARGLPDVPGLTIIDVSDTPPARPDPATPPRAPERGSPSPAPTPASAPPDTEHATADSAPPESAPPRDAGERPEVAASDLAYAMFTSGSTGRPKGVAVEHGSVLSFALDPVWAHGSHTRVLSLAPYAFGVSAYEYWVPLLQGAHIVIAPPGPVDVTALGRLITAERITAVHLTAGLFRVVAESAPHLLAPLAEVLTGGDVIAPGAVRRVLEHCPRTVVRTLYGATELTAFATMGTIRTPVDGPVVPVGHPLDGVRCHLLDEQMRPVPDGAEGELYVGGPRVARGYLGDPDETAARFLPDPSGGPGARMFRTGDLARRDASGALELRGRRGDQVKIRGYRVDPREVESVVAAGEGVVDVAVVVRDAGAAGPSLVAYVVGDADLGAVARLAAARLPGYAVPSALVPLASLPLTANGKLDRRALPDPPSPADDGAAPFRAPGTERQALLCELFAEVLEIGTVGLDDSFFDLDGQSLLALKLVSRIEAELGVELTVADLFNAPTVAELDAVIETALEGAS
ncbi:non-ribosomal peptide synthetase [Actinomadura flavalba]|uniref:non-ribosomal peptide synthetase n=1 Tax=Actinomadura flavalba TaxID=1120938 RepID=UPI000363A56B|nr:non-ribosomal peptide synthetase [Actinomadura flavalba]